jgi:hypothetical protein
VLLQRNIGKQKASAISKPVAPTTASFPKNNSLNGSSSTVTNRKANPAAAKNGKLKPASKKISEAAEAKYSSEGREYGKLMEKKDNKMRNFINEAEEGEEVEREDASSEKEARAMKNSHQIDESEEFSDDEEPNSDDLAAIVEDDEDSREDFDPVKLKRKLREKKKKEEKKKKKKRSSSKKDSPTEEKKKKRRDEKEEETHKTIKKHKKIIEEDREEEDAPQPTVQAKTTEDEPSSPNFEEASPLEDEKQTTTPQAAVPSTLRIDISEDVDSISTLAKPVVAAKETPPPPPLPSPKNVPPSKKPAAVSTTPAAAAKKAPSKKQFDAAAIADIVTVARVTTLVKIPNHPVQRDIVPYVPQKQFLMEGTLMQATSELINYIILDILQPLVDLDTSDGRANLGELLEGVVRNSQAALAPNGTCLTSALDRTSTMRTFFQSEPNIVDIESLRPPNHEPTLREMVLLMIKDVFIDGLEQTYGKGQVTSDPLAQSVVCRKLLALLCRSEGCRSVLQDDPEIDKSLDLCRFIIIQDEADVSKPENHLLNALVTRPLAQQLACAVRTFESFLAMLDLTVEGLCKQFKKPAGTPRSELKNLLLCSFKHIKNINKTKSAQQHVAIFAQSMLTQIRCHTEAGRSALVQNLLSSYNNLAPHYKPDIVQDGGVSPSASPQSTNE